MKVLLIGSNKIFSIENFYVKFMRQACVDLDTFFAHSIFIEYYQGFFNKVTFRLGLSRIYEEINEQLIIYIKTSQPEIIWVFKGMEIFPETLKWAKSQGIKLVNFNGDNPFLFTGRGSGNKNVVRSMNLYDLHFTYNLQTKKKFELLGSKVCFLPFGFDLDADVVNGSMEQKEVMKACFLGNPDPVRAQFILELAELGIKMDLFGHGWRRYLNHHNLSFLGPVYGRDQWYVLRRYRVQLNLMRIHNENSHNMRTFEVPGIGGIMVAPDTEEHRLFFEDGKEAFLFKDVNDCAGKINTIMNLSTEEASKIRNAARARSLNSGYNYQDRAFQAIKELKLLLAHG